MKLFSDMPPLSKYLLIHFFIGLIIGPAVESEELTYTYWFGAVMYLLAKSYVHGIRWAFLPRHKLYYYLHYIATIFALVLSTMFFLSLDSSTDLFQIAFSVSLLLFMTHFVMFLSLCTVIFLIRIPLNIRRRRAEKERRRQAEVDAQRAYEERQRLQAEHERQLREAAAMKVSDQQRRIDARADCELFYNLHLKHVGHRFPRESFEKFMSTYMTDDQPVAAVERRAAELRRVIQYHQESAKPPAKFKSIREVTEWYLKEKECLESLPINEEIRAEQLVTLEERYAELTQTMLEKIGT